MIRFLIRNFKIFKNFPCILHAIPAYAIMPIGKRNKCSTWAHENPRAATLGFSIPNFREGLDPQAGYRSVIAVQPFDDVVAGYTSRNSDQKRNKFIHYSMVRIIPQSVASDSFLPASQMDPLSQLIFIPFSPSWFKMFFHPKYVPAQKEERRQTQRLSAFPVFSLFC